MLMIRPGYALRIRSRRPVAPSRRLPPAHMSRTAFLRLTAIWAGAVTALLALTLAVRWLA